MMWVKTSVIISTTSPHSIELLLGKVKRKNESGSEVSFYLKEH